jgi:hypothetical protein
VNTEVEMVRLVREAVARVRTSAAESEVLAAMVRELGALPDAEAVSSLRVRSREFELTIGQLEYHTKMTVTLASIRELILTSAPDVVDCVPLSVHDHDGVLILRYSACPGERLIPAKATTGPFRGAAAAQFIEEMDALAARGKIHPYARSLSHWLLSSATETIHLERWSALRDGSEDECEELGLIVRDLIQDRGTT